MFIEYSEEQNMLRDSAERYLRDNYSFDSRQAAVKQASGFDAVQWQAFADLGWLAMTFDEDSGGFGGGALETMILCEQFGKFLVLEPYLESVVMVGGLIEAGAQPAIKEQYLTGLIAGELQGAFAYLEEGSVADPTHVKTIAEPSADGFILNGSKTVVLNGPEADFFIVSVSTGANHKDSSQGISLFVVAKDNPGLSLKNYKTYDGRSASELHMTDVAVSNLALVGELDNGFAIAAPIFSRAIVAVCAEAVGAMDALLAATVDYTKQRKQFGQSISGFQVLRHRMVDMFMEIELTRSLLMATAWKLDNNAPDAEQCVAALKAKVGKAGRYVSHNAVQLHGGIGTTDEFSVGHYFKRLATIGVMFGSRDSHLSRYSQLSAQVSS
jgi:alkylation response protein AidB-like acyl-CoA dehydrogenase|tara:strand:- start:220 stop:1368 length:1149 start_codon:yes stop_codon:yes gene_type:complete